MTREDAIDYVQAAFDAYESEFGIGDDWSKEHEARDMAIQALSQEPCTDAVSREDAIEAVKQAIYNHDSAIMRLTELPSVNPQPCDDTISREDALEALNTINGTAELDKAFEVIENLPSVTQKSGKWIGGEKKYREEHIIRKTYHIVNVPSVTRNMTHTQVGLSTIALIAVQKWLRHRKVRNEWQHIRFI